MRIKSTSLRIASAALPVFIAASCVPLGESQADDAYGVYLTTDDEGESLVGTYDTLLGELTLGGDALAFDFEQGETLLADIDGEIVPLDAERVDVGSTILDPDDRYAVLYADSEPSEEGPTYFGELSLGEVGELASSLEAAGRSCRHHITSRSTTTRWNSARSCLMSETTVSGNLYCAPCDQWGTCTYAGHKVRTYWSSGCRGG